MGSIKKYHQYAVVAIALVLLAAIAWGASGNANQSSIAPKSTDSQTTESKESISFTATGTDTVLEQLKNINSTVVTKETELGAYVDSINNLKGGSDGKYWTYYVNGTMGSVGADVYTPKKGEAIEWKFRN